MDLDFPWWLPLAIPLGIMSFFFVLLVAVWMCEQRRVVPFEVSEPAATLPPTDYSDRANDAAEDHGFTPLGTFGHAGGKMVQGRYDVWLSPDRSTVAVVGSGRVLKVPQHYTWLSARTADGRYLVTTDQVGEVDASGVCETATWPGVSFSDLARRHRDRLGRAAADPVPFGDDPLRDYLNTVAEVAQQRAEAGYIRFLDHERTTWRYTFKGAVLTYVATQITQPARRLARSLGLARD